jgi:hypothetical protein
MGRSLEQVMFDLVPDRELMAVLPELQKNFLHNILGGIFITHQVIRQIAKVMIMLPEQSFKICI